MPLGGDSGEISSIRSRYASSTISLINNGQTDFVDRRKFMRTTWQITLIINSSAVETYATDSVMPLF